MPETIFVNHEPGTYKAYRTVGGWVVMFLDENGNTHNAEGGRVYTHKQAAYRKAQHLNETPSDWLVQLVSYEGQLIDEVTVSARNMMDARAQANRIYDNRNAPFGKLQAKKIEA